MITFISSFVLLILGYLIYGRIVERIFSPNPKAKTPCFTHQDGVDYIPMPTWKVFLIQFLNIAGTGPIFGAIQGILFGPAAFFWIVLGCIFGGAVHDYMSGMLSLRSNGVSLPEMIGDQLGSTARHIMRVFTLVLLILVGAVFITTPASLLNNITDNFGGVIFWVALIMAYYMLATLLPIDKIIGNLYPVFGFALLIMAGGLFGGIFFCDGNIPEVTDAFTNHHPIGTMPLFPGLFITIACGAVSGFHASQSPMMARCMQNERLGRRIFYGAMITEGLVALIWAAAAIKFADSLPAGGDTPYEKLLNYMTDPDTGKMNPALLVNGICHSWLGTVGAVLAILGVVAAPITTGDTAFRSARLITADILHLRQDKVYKRLIICIPLFAGALALMFINFDVLWRYFGWSNQTLSIFTFWAVTVWLARHRRAYWITLVPCIFMMLVCSSYICIAPEGFSLSHNLSYAIAIGITLLGVVWFFYKKNRHAKLQKTDFSD